MVREALSALTDRAIVDCIGADGIHTASSSAGTEGDDGPVGVVELFPLTFLDVSQQFGKVFLVAWLGEPIGNIFCRPGCNFLRGESLLDCFESRLDGRVHGQFLVVSLMIRNAKVGICGRNVAESSGAVNDGRVIPTGKIEGIGG